MERVLHGFLALSVTCWISAVGEAAAATDNMFASPELDLSAPFGTRQDPVRCDRPRGEREYLARLRCPDRPAPTLERPGSNRLDRDGNILDIPSVPCPAGAVASRIYMRMYQDDCNELRAPAEFTIAQSSTEEHDERALYAEAQRLIDSYGGRLSVLKQSHQLVIKILNSNPESALAFVALGRLAYKAAYIQYDDYEQKGLDEAHALFSKALSIDPELFDAYYYGAYSYIFAKNNQKAKQLATKAQEIDRESAKVDLLFAAIAEKEKNYREIILRTDDIFSKTSDKNILKGALSFRKTVYRAQKQYDLLDKTYLEILELDPDSAWANVNYSSFLTSRKKYDKAIEYGERALALMNFGMAHRVLAKVFYKKGANLHWKQNKRVESRQYFLLAIKHDPKHAKAYYGLGMSYYHSGYYDRKASDLENAEKALEKAIRFKPDHKQAKKQLAAVRKLLKRMKQ